MSLDDLHLNSWLRKNLYGNHLVKEQTEQEMEIAGKETNKNSESPTELLILVNDPKHEFASDEETQLLERLLKACNIQPDEPQRVNIATIDTGLEEIIREYAPERVLVFGKDITLPGGISFDVPDSVSFANAQILAAPALTQLREQSSLRGALWERLQQFFDLNRTEK